ncbi:WXG100 family type VII secretion target [Streptomyces sp. SGAir0957]
MAENGTADYDTSVIDVSPVNMKKTGDDMTSLAQDVSDSLKVINTQLGQLKLAWQGKSAEDADVVAQDWLRVITELFGTEEDPSKGVLPALADGVHMSWSNFSTAEDGIRKLFADFHSALTGSGDGDGDSQDPPEEVTDTNKTAVTMTFPY